MESGSGFAANNGRGSDGEHKTLVSRNGHSYQPANTDDPEMESGSGLTANDEHGSGGEHEGPEMSVRRMV
jgi:hypothetical protein